MDDMQRYRDIKAEATEEDPTAKLRAQLTVAFDQALAEAIRLERQGKPGKVRALGFTETADLLGQPADLRQLIVDLTDEDPCEYDHHGYCQAHGWMATEPRCPHARAKELLTGQHRGRTTPVKETGRA